MPKIPMRRVTRGLLAVLILLVVVATGAGLWLRAELRASLARLDGQLEVAELSAPVEIQRDASGVPVIRGVDRHDVALATGFVHAQERFFQMDLARRRAAGELAALVGPAAIEADAAIRVHRFRVVASRAVALLGDDDRAVIEAYTRGVNAGLEALDGFPFEYLLLRQDPVPWQVEDSLLVVLSMFVLLQDNEGAYEATLASMHEALPPEVVDFLVPRGTEWDAPVVGPAFEQPPVPSSEVYDPRASVARIGLRPGPAALEPGPVDWWAGLPPETDVLGSNNWAVSGTLTPDGTPLLANDIHLGIRVPNTWYRAALQWPDPTDPTASHRLVGVTLPGLPSLVAGSNGYVAWGFTNSYTDSSDIVLLELDPADPGRYRTPDGWRHLERFDEVIEVAGGEVVHLPVAWTIWGPLLDPDHLGRTRAYRWVAHSAERLATNLRPLERARSVTEALVEAHGIGTPVQNLIAADRDGRIGWTLYGSIPHRVGLDGTVPVSWADGAGWDGWLDETAYPRVVDPDDGRLWTANARAVGGPGFEQFERGNHEVGSRATIIRDTLHAEDRFTPREMLDLQLDDSARFLERWRTVVLDVLTPARIGDDTGRTAFREIVERDWSGRASPDSSGYRLVTEFRDAVAARVFGLGLAPVAATDPAFRFFRVRAREGPLWALVTEQPAHWLEPGFDDWDAWLADVVDGVVADLTRGHEDGLEARVWSEVNAAPIRHPLSAAVPWLARWLDMPVVPMPGSDFTPRQQVGIVAASARIVVSPGNEAAGIMHMPTGQSGHPLSPFYSSSHGAWLRGEPTPLLPGPAEYRLTLVP